MTNLETVFGVATLVLTLYIFISKKNKQKEIEYKEDINNLINSIKRECDTNIKTASKTGKLWVDGLTEKVERIELELDNTQKDVDTVKEIQIARPIIREMIDDRVNPVEISVKSLEATVNKVDINSQEILAKLNLVEGYLKAKFEK